MLHLTKLAVGVRDPGHLRTLQAERSGRDPPLRHRTRNFPRRAAEITAGGSLFWAIGGYLLVRQRVLDIVADQWDDGSACAAIVLDRRLVRLVPRHVKPFQGWRYLKSDDAPEDIGAAPAAAGEAALPAELRHALRTLCLI